MAEDVDFDVSGFLQQVHDQFEANIGRAAANYADRAQSAVASSIASDELRLNKNWSTRRTGKTVEGVEAVKQSPFLWLVRFPFPWKFHEFGYVDRWGNYHRPVPVARQLLETMRGEIEAMMTEGLS